MCFSDSKKEEIMQKHGIARGHDEMLKLVADEWKELSEKDRAFWDEQSRNDKVRYVREKAAWKGPSLVPKRRAKKNPLAPKRPMSAFLKFSQTRRTKVKKENPDMSNTDVSRLLGEMWRKASVQEKAPYREQEAFERAIYNEDIKRFKSELTRLDAESRASHQSIHSHSHTSHRLSPQPSPDDDYHLHHHMRPLTSNSIHAFDTLRMDSFEEAPLATSGRGLVPYRPQYTSAHSPYGHAYSYHSHPGELTSCMVSTHSNAANSYPFPLAGYSSPHHGADYPADDPMQRAPIHRRASLDDEDHVPSRSSYFHDVNVGYYSRYP
jgi:hypothetical protein